jgi:hypothetical protein
MLQAFWGFHWYSWNVKFDFCKIFFFLSLVLGSNPAEPELDLCKPELMVQFKVWGKHWTEPKVWFQVLKFLMRTGPNQTMWGQPSDDRTSDCAGGSKEYINTTTYYMNSNTHLCRGIQRGKSKDALTGAEQIYKWYCTVPSPSGMGIADTKKGQKADPEDYVSRCGTNMAWTWHELSLYGRRPFGGLERKEWVVPLHHSPLKARHLDV